MRGGFLSKTAGREFLRRSMTVSFDVLKESILKGGQLGLDSDFSFVEKSSNAMAAESNFEVLRVRARFSESRCRFAVLRHRFKPKAARDA
jgi:hypothetical protein